MIKFPKKDDELKYAGMTLGILGGSVQCTTRITSDKEIPRKLGLMINWVNDKMMLAEHHPFQKLTIARVGSELRLELKLGDMLNDK